MYKKPEKEIERFKKVDKVQKVEVPENGNGGPYRFWFRANGA